MTRLWGLGLCTALAMAVNQWSPTLFLHTELVLGGSLAVLALLLWGWPGLLVGLAGGLSALPRTGDGVALACNLVALIGLQLFLQQANGGRRHRDNGRVVLAALAYWLLLGGVIEWIWAHQVLGLSIHLSTAMAARVAMVGVLDVVIGNALYVGWLLRRARHRRGAVSLQGVVLALLTVLLSVPAVLLATVRAAEVHQQALAAQVSAMQRQASLIMALPTDQRRLLQRQAAPPVMEERSRDGNLWQSDPGLFNRLAPTYQAVPTAAAAAPQRRGEEPPMAQLQLLLPPHEGLALQRYLNGYWQLVQPLASGGQIRLLQPARPLVEQLDGQLQAQSFGRLLLLLLLSGVISDRLARILSRQIDSLRRSGAQQTLRPSGLRELDALVRHVNQAEQGLAEAAQRQSQQESALRRQLERKLRSSLSAAAVVHEIKQPLSTMLLQCRLGLNLLQQQGLGAGFEVERTLQTLNDQADQVVKIMERMRMLLRNVETEHASVDLSLTVESALLFLQRELAVGGIDLESAGLDQPCLVLGDAVQLQIAVVNVIRNGIEALAGRNGRHLLQVRLDRREDAAVVQVSDNGPGFSTDATQLVLSSSKPQGSGIGLFVVRTTLEHHRGRLVIGRSARLGGAEVQLQLPMLECASGTATEPASATSALPDSSPDR